VPLVSLVLTVLQDLQEQQVFKVLLEQQDLKVLLVPLVLMVLQDLQEQQELKVLLVRLDLKV
jgi:hypothetical protein